MRDFKQSKPNQEIAQNDVNHIDNESSFWLILFIVLFCTFIGLHSVNKTPSFNQILIKHSEVIK